ncbi:MAG: hypothetical protein ABIR39_05570 [Nocardioides sp.]|uniref:hypothetical protein n=1 Tax=Nocardioides sp. TaxID=35761 RepID=UPI003264EF92
MTSPDGLDVLDQLRERIAVGPAPVTRILDGARARQRQRRRIMVLGAVALVAATIVATTSYRQTNRADLVVDLPVPELAVPWWSEGVLHLGAESVEIEDVTNLVATSTGAVVATSDGVVSIVVDSEVTAIGTKQPLPTFVVDPVRGWVAWPEPDHDIVVLDPATGTEVARRSTFQNGLDTTDWLIVLEDGVLTYDNRHGNRVWDIDADTQQRLGDGASYLMAQRGDDQLVLIDATSYPVLGILRASEELWRITERRPVSFWALSPDAEHLVGVLATGEGIVARDVGTGAPQATGLPGGTSLLSAAFLDSEAMAYTVEDAGAVDLFICDVPGVEASCETVVEERADLVLPDTFWMNPAVPE